MGIRIILYTILSVVMVPAVMGVETFTSTPEALYNFLVFGLWIFFLMTSFFKRGVHGKPIFAFGILELVLGLYIGTSFYSYSPMIGITVVGVSVAVFAYMMREG